jgi:hypothetical protein
MALKKIIELQGSSFLNTSYGQINTGEDKIAIAAYIKVVSISGDKNNLVVNVSFSDKDIKFIKSYSTPVSVEDNAPNFIKQAYEHLKTLPEFENSEDC